MSYYTCWLQNVWKWYYLYSAKIYIKHTPCIYQLAELIFIYNILAKHKYLGSNVLMIFKIVEEVKITLILSLVVRNIFLLSQWLNIWTDECKARSRLYFEASRANRFISHIKQSA